MVAAEESPPREQHYQRLHVLSAPVVEVTVQRAASSASGGRSVAAVMQLDRHRRCATAKRSSVAISYRPARLPGDGVAGPLAFSTERFAQLPTGAGWEVRATAVPATSSRSGCSFDRAGPEAAGAACRRL